MAPTNDGVTYSTPCADDSLLTGTLFFADDGDMYYERWVIRRFFFLRVTRSSRAVTFGATKTLKNA